MPTFRHRRASIARLLHPNPGTPPLCIPRSNRGAGDHFLFSALAAAALVSIS
jgi:hypothetical protein